MKGNKIPCVSIIVLLWKKWASRHTKWKLFCICKTGTRRNSIPDLYCWRFWEDSSLPWKQRSSEMDCLEALQSTHPKWLSKNSSGKCLPETTLQVRAGEAASKPRWIREKSFRRQTTTTSKTNTCNFSSLICKTRYRNLLVCLFLSRKLEKFHRPNLCIC